MSLWQFWLLIRRVSLLSLFLQSSKLCEVSLLKLLGHTKGVVSIYKQGILLVLHKAGIHRDVQNVLVMLCMKRECIIGSLKMGVLYSLQQVICVVDS